MLDPGIVLQQIWNKTKWWSSLTETKDSITEKNSYLQRNNYNWNSLPLKMRNCRTKSVLKDWYQFPCSHIPCKHTLFYLNTSSNPVYLYAPGWHNDNKTVELSTPWPKYKNVKRQDKLYLSNKYHFALEPWYYDASDVSRLKIDPAQTHKHMSSRVTGYIYRQNVPRQNEAKDPDRHRTKGLYVYKAWSKPFLVRIPGYSVSCPQLLWC